MTPPSPDATRLIRPLPAKPNLEKQRKLAKALMRAYCRGEAEATDRVQALHPDPPPPSEFVLGDAQLVIARSHGFPSWPKLKRKIDSLTRSPIDRFVDAVKAGDTDGLRQLLETHPDLAARINDPLFDFGRTAVHAARDNLSMLDLLLSHGADINAKSAWEKGGFGILEDVALERAGPLIARGAVVDVWAAAHLGMIDRLGELIASDPALVNAKGGDGKRPLHFARTVEIAAFLLDNGAEIDARDDDHDATPAQHLLGDRPDVCRFLISRGARTDLLMAAALGETELVRRHLEEDSGSIRIRVNQEWFPMIDTAENGGHIYQWSLGFHLSAFQVARKFGHGHVLELLFDHAPPVERLLDALALGDLAAADTLLAENPELIQSADHQTLRQIADAARNNDMRAFRAMLTLGFPVDARSQHGATPLHWAAFHGNPEMMVELLNRDSPLESRDRDYDSTAVGWTIHGAAHGWSGISTGRHAECLELLLNAGARFDESEFPTGHDALDKVLRERLFGR